MKSILKRNIRREFKFSIARFLSIVVLLALGSFVLIGLNVTGSDMRRSANDYYESHNLADAEIQSNVGLTKDDQKKIKALAHVKQVEFTTYKDAVIKGGHEAIRLQGKTTKLSTSQAVKGRLPKHANEVALSNAEKNHYKIGDQFEVVDNDGSAAIEGLKESRFKVVGFVNSSRYLQKQSLGPTKSGAGEVTTFGILSPEVFSSTTPTVAEIKYDNVSGKAYSHQYEKQVQTNVDAAQDQLNVLANARDDALMASINHSLTKLSATAKKTQQTVTLLDQQLKAAPIVTPEMTSKKDTLAEMQRDLKDKQARLTTEKQQLKGAGGVNYAIKSRSDFNPGYDQFGEDAERIDDLGKSFPIIFFAVSILVTVTTMARMAEQKRIELGTLRALGYSEFDALKVFLLYGISAGLIGSVLGAWLGTTLLPQRIFEAYAANIIIPNFTTPPSVFWISLAVLLSITVATLPALVVAVKSLKERPADLMLPKPPKQGANILLERFPAIWKRFSFNYKVTARNLARYKSRMFMTILGVLGCTALLITGFGIRDSLKGLVNSQYSDIIHYDVISVYNNQAPKVQKTQYRKAVDDLNGVKTKTNLYYQSVTVRPKGADSNQSVSLVVPETTNHFNQYVTLKNPQTQTKLKLGGKGVVLTEKLARVMKVKKGSWMTVTNAKGEKTRVKVAGITQMYAGHYLYMDREYYEKAFKTAYQTNATMLKLNDRSVGNANKVAAKLNQQKAAVTTSLSGDVKTTINNIMAGLNNMVIIITLAASALAFVVLFTLTNINVSERIRELSTIKVLGFYKLEVVMYVYRETLFLTLAGILAGYVGGSWLHFYIMQTLPPATAMADLTLLWTNFGISGGLTIVFSMIVMAMMARKINRIDMLEALKSVD